MRRLKSWLFVGLLALVAAVLASKPKKDKKLRWKTAYDALREALGDDCSLMLVDNSYYSISKADMHAWLETDPTNEGKYVPEYHDCDDFAFRLKGAVSGPGMSKYAIAWACSEVHAYNLFISPDRQVYLIEPQTDQIIPVEKDLPEQYHTVMVLM